MNDRVWLNGQITPASEARIDPSDRGFLLGDGAFETMRVEACGVRRFARHRNRIAAALDELDIAAPDWDQIEAAIVHLAAEAGLTAAIARLTVSRGPMGRGLDAPGGLAGVVLATVDALREPPSQLKLVSLDAPRREPTSQSARFKPIGYGDSLQARRRARAAGADMAVMLSSSGDLACADAANLYWVSKGRVFTPSLNTGALRGVTRAAVLDAANAAGLVVEEGRFGPDKLAACEAAAVSNAAIGVRPAAMIDGRELDRDHALISALVDLEREVV
ncbi:MAG: aminotransferase class IV [Pseudomonadota bacterium]